MFHQIVPYFSPFPARINEMLELPLQIIMALDRVKCLRTTFLAAKIFYCNKVYNNSMKLIFYCYYHLHDRCKNMSQSQVFCGISGTISLLKVSFSTSHSPFTFFQITRSLKNYKQTLNGIFGTFTKYKTRCFLHPLHILAHTV